MIKKELSIKEAPAQLSVSYNGVLRFVAKKKESLKKDINARKLRISKDMIKQGRPVREDALKRERRRLNETMRVGKKGTQKGNNLEGSINKIQNQTIDKTKKSLLKSLILKGMLISEAARTIVVKEIEDLKKDVNIEKILKDSKAQKFLDRANKTDDKIKKGALSLVINQGEKRKYIKASNPKKLDMQKDNNLKKLSIQLRFKANNEIRETLSKLLLDKRNCPQRKKKLSEATDVEKTLKDETKRNILEVTIEEEMYIREEVVDSRELNIEKGKLKGFISGSRGIIDNYNKARSTISGHKKELNIITNVRKINMGNDEETSEQKSGERNVYEYEELSERERDKKVRKGEEEIGRLVDNELKPESVNEINMEGDEKFTNPKVSTKTEPERLFISYGNPQMPTGNEIEKPIKVIEVKGEATLDGLILTHQVVSEVGKIEKNNKYTLNGALSLLRVTFKNSSYAFDEINKESVLFRRAKCAAHFIEFYTNSTNKCVFIHGSGFKYHLDKTEARLQNGEKGILRYDILDERSISEKFVMFTEELVDIFGNGQEIGES
ncbi:hypothetical protein K502DRAFT_363155 [Neoconidiobolus thromboides FSU 785]|nr:hypothetical protein K502DRAFT_363155 [Neoconidiobolus thromboides FSU 785]